MDLRPCSLLLHWTLVVALALLAQEVLAQHIYTNTWAVLVPAGPQEADRLARKHGFLNLGPVSPLLPSPYGSGVFCHLCCGLGRHWAGPWSWLGGCSFWQQSCCVRTRLLQPSSIRCVDSRVVISWTELGPSPASGMVWWHGTAQHTLPAGGGRRKSPSQCEKIVSAVHWWRRGGLPVPDGAPPSELPQRGTALAQLERQQHLLGVPRAGGLTVAMCPWP